MASSPLIFMFKAILALLLVFAALGLLCAVRIGRRATPPADPFFLPFGEMPGFSAEQLSRFAPPVRNADPLRRSFAACSLDLKPSGVALRPDADGGGPSAPSGLAAVRKFFWRYQ